MLLTEWNWDEAREEGEKIGRREVIKRLVDTLSKTDVANLLNITMEELENRLK